MDNVLILLLTGFIIGSFGTLIGAGGGFLLVPLLILTKPELSAETITAISIFIVAVNAISGSIAYAKSGRIDFKAGLLFAICTVPGSILGVLSTQFIPRDLFNYSFGILLICLAIFLLFKTYQQVKPVKAAVVRGPAFREQHLTDKEGVEYDYTYNQTYGIIVSILVGYLSPLLGIGGGIIHVPAMVHWLQFPVYIATATSHFILAIMSTVSVIVHAIRGSYHDPAVIKMILWLSAGVVPGAQLGAYLSHKIKSRTIIRALAVCLALVGIRILLQHL